MNKKLYVLQFKDNPEKTHLRPKYLDAHLQFLKDNIGMIISAGSILEADTNLSYGGMWLVWAENETEVKKMYIEDPFWINEMREGVQVFEWVTALENGKFLK